jgi:SPX domain protein involved in polyphosphate accumulation
MLPVCAARPACLCVPRAQKKIKKMPSKEQLAALGPEAAADAEQAFVLALSDTLHSLNDTYMEKEETSVIRVERLEHQLATAAGAVELAELHKQLVDFHGEVLLLMHWSILAYTATVKILKKHHKRTGLLVQAPQLGNLLAQPFCSTEVRGGGACAGGCGRGRILPRFP